MAPLRSADVSGDAPYRSLTGEVLGRLPGVAGRPLILGIAGPVSVGKSTTAAILRDLLAEHGVRTDVVCTDCFLHDNAVLAARDLLMRKGFPETFDVEAMEMALRRLRDGHGPVPVPVYSHETYDIVPGQQLTVGDADVVVVEGVNALQPPATEYYDVAVYVDADEADVRRWFVDRFLELCRAGADGAGFYAMFGDMTDEARAAVAHGAWHGINGPNLREHIAPSRHHATFVLRKTSDHAAVLEVV